MDELTRLREIEHMVWHVLDDSEEDAQTGRISFDGTTDDYRKLTELLPEGHPHYLQESNMEEHGIGWAIKQLHDGSKVRRAGWNGKGMWLLLVAGSRVPLREGTPYHAAMNTATEGQSHVTINPHIDMYTATGEMQPGWLASQTDLLATDWEIAE